MTHNAAVWSCSGLKRESFESSTKTITGTKALSVVFRGTVLCTKSNEQDACVKRSQVSSNLDKAYAIKKTYCRTLFCTSVLRGSF